MNMDKRLQAYLDGELERSALPADLRAEAERWDELDALTTELRAEGKHVASWKGKACVADLRAAVEAHKAHHAPLPDRRYRIILHIALNKRDGAPATVQDGAKLHQVERYLLASERRRYRLRAALDWLGAANLSWAVRPKVPEPDSPDRELAHYPPFVEPEKPKRKRKPGPRKPRKPYPNVRY